MTVVVKHYLSYIIIGILIDLFFANSCFGKIDLPWSTTYDCAKSVQGSGRLNCDGLSWGGGWSCDGTHEEITSRANYRHGGGGCGQRHWVGDGSNKNSGGTVLNFNSPQIELWIRWYMRYEKGFTWDRLQYDKILYIHTDKKSVDAIVAWLWGDHFVIGAQGAGGHYKCKNCGWMSVMRGRASDGRWHCYEIHIKMDTNGRNGVAEAWIDGNKILSKNMVNFGRQKGWKWILIGSNQSSPNNGRCMAVDFDDIAISNLGRIGPLKKAVRNIPHVRSYEYKNKRTEENDSAQPAPPTGLKIIQK